MVYEGSQSLDWVAEYTGDRSTPHWCALCSNAGVPDKRCRVPKKSIIGGLGGNADQDCINKLCNSDIRGYMVWYASADNGF